MLYTTRYLIKDPLCISQNHMTKIFQGIYLTTQNWPVLNVELMLLIHVMNKLLVLIEIFAAHMTEKVPDLFTDGVTLVSNKYNITEHCEHITK